VKNTDQRLQVNYDGYATLIGQSLGASPVLGKIMFYPHTLEPWMQKVCASRGFCSRPIRDSRANVISMEETTFLRSVHGTPTFRPKFIFITGATRRYICAGVLFTEFVYDLLKVGWGVEIMSWSMFFEPGKALEASRRYMALSTVYSNLTSTMLDKQNDVLARLPTRLPSGLFALPVPSVPSVSTASPESPASPPPAEELCFPSSEDEWKELREKLDASDMDVLEECLVDIGGASPLDMMIWEGSVPCPVLTGK